VKLPKRKHIKPDEIVKLSLTIAQVDVITELTSISENLLALFYAAKVINDKVFVRCTFEDLKQLSKYVADEAKKMQDIEIQQKLYDIFKVVRMLEQSYYGASLRIVAGSWHQE
jgi:hypothetical protein